MDRGRTKVTELRERIVKLGGTPKGRTVADLLDELEGLITGGGLSPDDVERIVARSLDEKLPEAVASAVEDAVQTGGLSDDDMDDIFGGE